MTYINNFKALVTGDYCHVIATTNMFINTTARLLEERKGSREGKSVIA